MRCRLAQKSSAHSTSRQCGIDSATACRAGQGRFRFCFAGVPPGELQNIHHTRFLRAILSEQPRNPLSLSERSARALTLQQAVSYSMISSPTFPVFDGHNDMLQAFFRGERNFFERSDEGHIDLPRAIEGGLAGGFCALFVRSEAPEEPLIEPVSEPDVIAQYDLAFDPTPELGPAQQSTISMMGTLLQLERDSDGRLKVVRTAAEIEQCLQDGVFAALMHIEGAECIDPDLNALYVFHVAGLRSLGPVWSRPNDFAQGVPFAFPHSPDTGPGLTEAGERLVRACNDLGILVDVSHLNEKGFWDIARITTAPIVATHSNPHAICPSSRNLTDKQLDAIRDSDGMVGINFHVRFLRPDGQRVENTPLDLMAQHVDYLVERIGIDHVGFGSDFDGAVMPQAVRDASGLPHLVAWLKSYGYSDEALRKITHGNWLRVLRQTWREQR